MKKTSLRVLMVSLSLMQVAPSLVMAQTNPLIVAGQGRGSVFAGSGDYNMRMEDVSAVLGKILDEARITQKFDRDYLLSSVETLQKDYENLVGLVMTGDLLKMSQRSQNSETIDVKEFFATINTVNAQLDIVKSRIAKLTALNPSTLPSVAQLNDGKNVQSLQNFGQINWAPITEAYSVRLESLRTVASNYMIKVKFANGIPVVIPANSGTTLAPKFNMPVFSAAEVAGFRKEINAKRTPPQSFRDTATLHTNQTRDLIFNFVQQFGFDERYRFRDDSKLLEDYGKGKKTVVEGISLKDHFKQRDEMFQQIVEVMWQRSYLRLKSGIQAGALQPGKYDKKWGNLDKFLVMTKSLSEFREEPALTETELAGAAENMRMVLKVLDERSTEILGEESSSSLLVKANSAMTFIGGMRPSAEVLFMVMQLVAGDIQEELLLTKAGGLAQLRDFYRGRYQSSPESLKLYAKMKCAIDSDMAGDESCAEFEQSNPFAVDVVVNANGGIRTTFNLWNSEIGNMAAQLEEADLAEAQLKIAMASNQSVQRAKARARDL